LEGSGLKFVDLAQEHILHGAQLFANRNEALSIWPRGASIAELGVGFGGYTHPILKQLGPSRFDAYDTFVLHKLPEIWGKPLKVWLEGKPTHRAFYEHRFAPQLATGVLSIFEGDSSTNLSQRDPETYDVIYIDGDHTFDGARKDAESAIKTLKRGGMLVFNDYICFDPNGKEYGVIPVVNDLCLNHGWRVKYFALQFRMFCDIGLVQT
jgi:hypothetical protein